MAALSFKKKAFQKKKGKAVFSKAKEYKAKSKTTPIKKSKPLKKGVEVPATAENTVLKLMGLPFSVTDEAIIEWFVEDGVTPETVHRCDTNTWKSGMAYATFSSTDLLQKGLKMHRTELDGRYINVVMKRKAEMESVLQCVSVLDTIVRMRGLPYDCKNSDIIEFFKGLPIRQHGVYIKRGDAYVRFKDAATAQKALKKNDCYIGERYVKVYTCKLQQLTDLKYTIIKSKNEGHNVLKKFLSGSEDSSVHTQSPVKKNNLKAASKTQEEESLELDEEMQEESASSEEEDSEISFADAVDEPMEETPPKKQKKTGDMTTGLSKKGFAVKTNTPMFTEIVKKPNSAVKKSGGIAKRTSMVAAKDSDDEMVPQLVAVTPKLKGTPMSSHKRLSTGKKGKRRSMFTATPK